MNPEKVAAPQRLLQNFPDTTAGGRSHEHNRDNASGTENLQTPRWREMDSNFSSTAAQKPRISAAFRALRGIGGALKRYHLILQPFFCASNHSIEPGWGAV